jgi:hypothetical protein
VCTSLAKAHTFTAHKTQTQTHMKNLSTSKKKVWVAPKLLNLKGEETNAGNTPAITEGFVFYPGSTGQS